MFAGVQNIDIKLLILPNLNHLFTKIILLFYITAYNYQFVFCVIADEALI